MQQTRPTASRFVWPIATGFAVAVTVYVVAFLAIPSARDQLIVEDGIIETTTALVFLGAAAVGMVAMFRTGARRFYWIVPTFGLFGFLDEMSFGARIFGFPLPVIDGLEVDSFHDIFDLADRFAGDVGVSRTQIAALGAALALMLVVYLLKSGRMGRIPEWLSSHRPIALLIAAIGLLVVAVGLDLIGTSDMARFAEETAEFGAAGLTAVAAFDIFSSRTQSPGTIRLDSINAGEPR